MTFKEMIEMPLGAIVALVASEPGYVFVYVTRVPGGWLYTSRCTNAIHSTFIEEPAYAIDEEGRVEML